MMLPESMPAKNIFPVWDISLDRQLHQRPMDWTTRRQQQFPPASGEITVLGESALYRIIYGILHSKRIDIKANCRYKN